MAGRVGLSQRTLPTRGDVATDLSNVPSYGRPAAPAVNTFKYDSLRGVYNYKGPTSRITDHAFGNAMLPNGGMAEHLIIGDSVSAGCISSNTPVMYDRLRAWPRAMQDGLAATGMRANGTGFVRAVDGANIDSRWVFAGSWSGFNSCTQSTTATANATFTSDRSGSVCDVWYYDSAGGTFTVAVDGASSGAGFTTVTANGSAGWKYVRLYGVTITQNVSTVKITLTTVGASGIIFSGINIWTPNGGLIVHNVAQSGSTAYSSGASPTTAWDDISTGTALGFVYNNVAGRKVTLTNVSSTSGSSTLTSSGAGFNSTHLGMPIDEINLGASRMWPANCYIGAILSSTTVTIYTGVGSTAAPVNALATLSSQSVNIGRDPACVHIALGLNDLQQSFTDTQITTAISNIRARFSNSEIILHLTHEMSTAVVSGARTATFQKAMFALAESLDVPLFDWRDRIGTFANGSANGDYGDNVAHLVPAAYASIGASLGAIFGGGSGVQQNNWTPALDADLTPKIYVDAQRIEPYPLSKGGTLAVGTGVFKIPIAGGTFKIASIIAQVNTAPTGASILIDVNKGTGAGAATTIFATQGNRPTIAASGVQSTVGAWNTGLTYTTGDYISVDIDQVGSTVAGADLVIVIRLQRTA